MQHDAFASVLCTNTALGQCTRFGVFVVFLGYLCGRSIHKIVVLASHSRNGVFAAQARLSPAAQARLVERYLITCWLFDLCVRFGEGRNNKIVFLLVFGGWLCLLLSVRTQTENS